NELSTIHSKPETLGCLKNIQLSYFLFGLIKIRQKSDDLRQFRNNSEYGPVFISLYSGKLSTLNAKII
ncbi:hypothetical protein DWX43_04030, partial [Clostridium sp. AF19-22AC]